MLCQLRAGMVLEGPFGKEMSLYQLNVVGENARVLATGTVCRVSDEYCLTKILSSIA